jgi:thiol-disulfide isomerase/thioredoxin
MFCLSFQNFVSLGMKKPIAILALFLATAYAVSAQTDSLPPFKRFPTVPPLKLLLTDSTTWFTKDDVPKKKQVLVMLFSPECDHCKHETEEIIKNMKGFEKIEIVMATSFPFSKMKEFYFNYNLKQYNNIVVGNDVSYLLPVFYNVRNLPFLAFYNKKGELIDTYEGTLPIEKVLEKFD